MWHNLGIRITVSQENWLTVFDEQQKKLLKGYPEFFTERLNLFGVPCVLSSQNKYIGKTITILLRCTIKGCSRTYRLKTADRRLFALECIGEMVHDNLTDDSDADTDKDKDTDRFSDTDLSSDFENK